MSLEQLTEAERDALVSMKVQYAYAERPEADEVIKVSDLIDGQIVERPASFDECWIGVLRELTNLPEQADPAE